MTPQQSAQERLLTWLDIERQLKQRTSLWNCMPEGISLIDCFVSGMEVHHSCPEADVKEWLAEIFGSSYNKTNNVIRLRIGNAAYPVEFLNESQSESSDIERRTYPLWKEVTYVHEEKDKIGNKTEPPLKVQAPFWPTQWSSGPDLVSFHSFKGGVGRTTTLMTFVAACMQEVGTKPKRILVIDADLEAPGVSFWLDDVNKPAVSFVQLLEALHYPPTNTNETLDFFCDELRKTSLSLSGIQQELFILPAALDLSEIQDMPVAPEHLARNPQNPWQLSDYIHSLGQRLGVDAIFLDLRAGLSELASPILFDPRVDHFFVSTVAPQSVLGMREVLSRLHAFNSNLPLDRQRSATPTVVLSLLTKELREAGYYERALSVLNNAYPSNDTLTAGIVWLEADFQNTLMSVGSVRESLQVLPQSNRLFSSAKEWAQALYTEQKDSSLNLTQERMLLRQEKAKRLQEVCQRAQFAESDANAPILAIEPLLNLGKHFSKEPPNALMIGAKGAGKTFTYMQLVRTNSWLTFLTKLGFESNNIVDANIFPVLWSSNIEDTPKGEIKTAQNLALKSILADNKQIYLASTLSNKIRDNLKNPPDSWDAFWDELIIQQFGLGKSGLQELNNRLAQAENRVVLVFDGIEDVFEDVNQKSAVDAIQALLRLPNRMSELENRHLGTLIFVRADYVQAAIRQNLGQLLQRFHPFQLQWNPESFLRLAFMLSCQAGIYPDDPKSSENMRIEQLKDRLEELWGKKLGTEKSKEAHSARWVYSALCDLKGNVQARDLVRFLKFAAGFESTRSSQAWADRILSPENMRKAIPECSREKVAEAKQEIAPLRRWTGLMESSGVNHLKVPFSPEQAKLDTNLLSSLQEIGVIYEDLDGKLGEERLFLPEIYRYGLGFDTSATGRPRTQALLKKNIGSIPL
ncbi:ParA family protein [Permianibacter aggregans]|uniref:AAA domain-containing protein n=1 Tax=Permianibacter aggregans TaxID=1510150 RepID=A0A4R6US20_9GAMM|nr:ParA family protein [Permianibacter aggregans]QGX41030.1 ParA family protein [Permianibacter aggregans]TDQ48095.1 hypothetical protein EV696_10875 [Permianibacter aggregans]